MDYEEFLGQEPMFVRDALAKQLENVVVEETADPRASKDNRVAKVIRIKKEMQTARILVGFFQRPHI